MSLLVPNIFIHECFSGGGWPEPDLPQSLTAEGLAMLQAARVDFQAWGGAKITTTCDCRLVNVSLPSESAIDGNRHAVQLSRQRNSIFQRQT